MRWLNLFARSGIKRLNELKYLQKEEPVLWKAYEVLTHLPSQIQNQSQEAQEMYQLTEQEKAIFTQIGIEKGIEKGIETGIETGIERGIEKEKIEVAKRLFQLNMDVSIIKEATGLTLEQLESILK